MKRRQFITLVGGAAVAWPLAARAQQTDRMPRVGVLMPYPKSDPVAQSGLAAFLQGFRTLGRVDGSTVRIETRWADGGFDEMQRLAKKLVALRPDVILASSGAPSAAALLRETRTIPIVFTSVSDPVGLGFVESLARPGGNITGFSLYEPSIGTKWLDSLKALAPAVRRIVLLFNPRTSVPALYLPSIEPAAASLALDLIKRPVQEPSEIEAAMATLGAEPGGGLMCLPDTYLIAHRQLILDLANRYDAPAVYPLPLFATSGGLMSYGVDLDDINRRAAGYVEQILRGAKPAELPVQQPTKYELVLNLKAAKSLGLSIPPSLLAIADEVIE